MNFMTMSPKCIFLRESVVLLHVFGSHEAPDSSQHEEQLFGANKFTSYNKLLFDALASHWI